VDPEIAHIAGPQLVVPVSNARYALNAANARWGSLYDALYGTDAIPDVGEAARGGGYSEARGALVVDRARQILDQVAPLANGSHADARGYTIVDGRLAVSTVSGQIELAAPDQLVGYAGDAEAPSAVMLRHHGLHLELRIDRENRIGRNDPAGLADVIVESAVTTIMDCEDSVATVDAPDKVAVYRNWLGLMNGTLTTSFEKGGRVVERRLHEDHVYTAPRGGSVRLPGRSLLEPRSPKARPTSWSIDA
jgi:malate synthase